MCTVTFVARRRGYALGMNRDEKLSRAQGLPPARRVVNGRAALFPSEPSGGTWISVNEAGAAFALINWYSVDARVVGSNISRGEVVKQILALESPDQVGAALAGFRLGQVNPFRLIGVFPALRAVVQWRWDVQQLERIEHRWQTSTWISSGFDEEGAQQTRAKIFREALRGGPLELGQLRQLHRSHSPEPGPYSHCMHRVDAATVSYTEIVISDRAAAMRHTSGAPCCSRLSPAITLRLVTGRELFGDGDFNPPQHYSAVGSI